MDKQRVPWTTRVNILPEVKNAIRILAQRDRVPVATVVGRLLETHITIGSTA